jgi:hypothetical protein
VNTAGVNTAGVNTAAVNAAAVNAGMNTGEAWRENGRVAAVVGDATVRQEGLAVPGVQRDLAGVGSQPIHAGGVGAQTGQPASPDGLPWSAPYICVSAEPFPAAVISSPSTGPPAGILPAVRARGRGGASEALPGGSAGAVQRATSPDAPQPLAATTLVPAAAPPAAAAPLAAPPAVSLPAAPPRVGRVGLELLSLAGDGSSAAEPPLPTDGKRRRVSSTAFDWSHLGAVADVQKKPAKKKPAKRAKGVRPKDIGAAAAAALGAMAEAVANGAAIPAGGRPATTGVARLAEAVAAGARAGSGGGGHGVVSAAQTGAALAAGSRAGLASRAEGDTSLPRAPSLVHESGGRSNQVHGPAGGGGEEGPAFSVPLGGGGGGGAGVPPGGYVLDEHGEAALIVVLDAAAVDQADTGGGGDQADTGRRGILRTEQLDTDGGPLLRTDEADADGGAPDLADQASERISAHSRGRGSTAVAGPSSKRQKVA